MNTTGVINSQATATKGRVLVEASWCSPYPQQKTQCCVELDTPTQRPDLATYSQNEQISLGNAPSWNSPDITTNNDFPWTLLPAVLVVVRNLAAVASAVNALVNLSLSDFGIGMQQTLLSSQKLNLGPGQASTLSFQLPTNVLAGPQSIGTYVVIEAAYDSNLINNSGSQVVTGLMASAAGRSPVLSFPVVNASSVGRTISLSVMPNALGATVSPTSKAYIPWEQIAANLSLNVPASMHGTPAAPIQNEITVVAYAQDGSLVGGATWEFWVDN